MTDLQALFWPKSIALVGASPDKQIIRGRLVEAIGQHPYPGRVYAVSRSHRKINDLACFQSIDALPAGVDLAIITIPAEFVPAALEACGHKGIGAAIVISSGFAEEKGDQGSDRQQQLAEIAAHHGIALIGPNAEGFLNTKLNLAATFSPTVSDVEGGLRPAGLNTGGVAVISQSGGIGFSFFHRGRPKALHFSFIVTTGNEATLDVLDMADYLIEDDGTEVILMFVEGVRSPARLLPLAAKAARAGKPIVVAKVGQSEAAADAVTSHTASLAGSSQAYEAVFRHAGIIRGIDSDHMIDVAGAFVYFRDRLPRGHRVGILTPSGGAGAWFADLCEAHGLHVPMLDARTRARIDPLLPEYGTSRNPVDVTAQVIFKVGYAPVLEIMAESDVLDAILVSGSLAHPTYIERDLEQLVKLAEAVDKPVIFCAYTRAHPRAVELLAQAGFPCLTSMPNAARAIAAMADYRAFSESSATTIEVLPEERIRLTGPALDQSVYTEYEAKQHFDAWGIRCPKGSLTRSSAEAAAAAERLGGTVVAKVQSPDIPHKTEAGGIRLDLGNADAARQAYDQIMTAVHQTEPEAQIQGVLIEPMASAGVEMIVGVSRDPDFGPMLTVGSGGILVELIGDAVTSPVPVSSAQAQDLLKRLRGWSLLQGLRGQPAADVEALVELIVAVSRFAVANANDLRSLDLNPVIVHPAGNGLTIADALIMSEIRSAESHAHSEH
ncbi:MAG: acetate--CoA ligase family protein [Arenicellales bacterium]|nr:acetate--CoA ligase family protein [Arenicellales bacterium]